VSHPLKGSVVPHVSPTDDFRDAFEALVRAHYQRLANLAYRYLQSDAAAEDAVQEVLLKVWRRRKAVNLADPLPYLYQAVRNECLMALRRRRRWAMTGLDAEEIEAPAGEGEAAVDLQAAITRAVAALPGRCRLVFTMHREQDLSYAEIARILGISRKTVENQMGRALRTLRKRLAAHLPALLAALPVWEAVQRYSDS